MAEFNSFQDSERIFLLHRIPGKGMGMYPREPYSLPKPTLSRATRHSRR